MILLLLLLLLLIIVKNEDEVSAVDLQSSTDKNGMQNDKLYVRRGEKKSLQSYSDAKRAFVGYTRIIKVYGTCGWFGSFPIFKMLEIT